MHILRTSALLALLTIGLSQAASPPACLLAAINETDKPGDVPQTCKNAASKVQQYLLKACPKDDQAGALSAFADTCKAEGVQVPKVSASGTSGTSPTGTSGDENISAGVADPTASPSGAAGAVRGNAEMAMMVAVAGAWALV